jgi:hypothetical protein
VASTDSNPVLDADDDGFYDPKELETAVRSVYQDYNWPEDYYISLDHVVSFIPQTGTSPEGNPTNIRFAVGYEHTMIDMFHECAWMNQWADHFTAGEPTQANASLDQLESIISHSTTLAEPDKVRFQGWIEQARLGDPSGLMIFVDGGQCETLPWDSLPSTPRSSAIPSSRSFHQEHAWSGSHLS